MPDEPPLDVPFSIEIQLQINDSGLYVVMSQVVFNVRYGMAAVEHINRT